MYRDEVSWFRMANCSPGRLENQPPFTVGAAFAHDPLWKIDTPGIHDVLNTSPFDRFTWACSPSDEPTFARRFVILFRLGRTCSYGIDVTPRAALRRSCSASGMRRDPTSPLCSPDKKYENPCTPPRTCAP